MAQIRLKSLHSLYNNPPVKPLQVIFTLGQTYQIPAGYKSMDVFLVGGGASGGAMGAFAGPLDAVMSSGGGGGGNTTTQTLLSLNSKETITITIGAGGAGADGNNPSATGGDSGNAGNDGGNTTLQYHTGTITANGGEGGFATSRYNIDTGKIVVSGGGNGGSGGGCGGVSSTTFSRERNTGVGGSVGSDGEDGGDSDVVKATGQGTTTKAFEENTGTLYAGAGGGGRAHRGAGGRIKGASAGGDGGGTSGSNDSNPSPSASANTGGGSGGAYSMYHPPEGSQPLYGYSYDSGDGGSGIAIIRLYKDSSRPTVTWNNNNTINL